MPSSEDCINKENEARQLAVAKVMETGLCSSKRLAEDYVRRLSKKEIAEMIGWPAPGQAYSAW